MSALSSLLPKPRNNLQRPEPTSQLEKQKSQFESTIVSKGIPPYGQRQDYRPRTPEDFGNGGAFPEIHIAQYPLDMGRKKEKQIEKSGQTLTLELDADGNVMYDAIVRQGHGENHIVHSSFKDLVPLNERKDVNIEKIAMDRPTGEEVQSVADKTRAALEKIVNVKIKAAQPKNVVSTSGGTNKDPTYIRYTPAQGGSNGANQRIIRMVDAPVDPMEPPSYTHKKIPRGPPSPVAAVMHSPPRKLTAKEQAEWVIPPCISNWKNTKGYTIPLDKRLAADGRGLQEIKINDKFANLSEALYSADRHARDEVRQRNMMQQKIAQKQREAEEDKLRNLAQKAREERAGLKPSSSSSAAGASASASSSSRPTAASMMAGHGSSDESGSGSGSESEGSYDSDHSDDSRASEGSDRGRAHGREDGSKARERDQLRRERQKKRERDMRMSRMGTEARAKQMAREAGRDISEKIALGLAKPTMSKESMFDARLFNQSEGISSGFKDDEAYNLYDKPLFTEPSSSIYKFKSSAQNDVLGSLDSEELEESIRQDKFGIAKNAFKGAEGGSKGSDGPVEFEKDIVASSKSGKSQDVFGLDSFLNKAKKGKRSREVDDDDDDNDRRRR